MTTFDKGLLTVLVLGLIVLAAGIGVMNRQERAITATVSTPSPTPSPAPSPTPSPTPTGETKAEYEARLVAELEAKEAAAAPKWKYLSHTDEMGRGTISEASIASSNMVTFDFPYSGEQRALLSLRKHPKYGRDVILRVERGQFMTSSWGNEWMIEVSFDDGPIQKFTIRPAADGTSNVAFVSGYDKFASKLRMAKHVKIEAPFFHEGTRVFDFYVEGLEWK